MARKEMNRNEYNRVRKLDHKQMEAYVEEIYKRGFEAGKVIRDNEINIDMVMDKISTIPGIGEKKLAQIKDSITGLFTEGV